MHIVFLFWVIAIVSVVGRLSAIALRSDRRESYPSYLGRLKFDNCFRVGVAWLLVSSVTQIASGQAFPADVQQLIESSCVDCHDASTETPLNFEKLGHDLKNPDTFRQWEKIFDRITIGEMPPESEPRPDKNQRSKALGSLENRLRETNLAQQKATGRVPTRRLTSIEYEHTLHDLLGVRGELAKHLPPENASSTFDTVAAQQGISVVHIRSYLNAADIALDEAIQLGPRPHKQPVEIKYRSHPYSTMWLDRPLRLGGSTVKLVDDAWVTFDDRPHVAQSNHMGYQPPYPGLYRITAQAYGYQAKTPVTMLLYRSSEEQGGAELLTAFELPPGETRTIEMTSYLTPEDFFYPAPSDHDWQPNGRNVFSGIGAKTYQGEGLAIKWLKIQGPLEERWPPETTRRILPGVDFRKRQFKSGRQGYEALCSKPIRDQLEEIIAQLGPKIFRRPLMEDEVSGFVGLAEPLITSNRPINEVVRVPLKAMFSSPQFLFHAGGPGKLNDFALATRLSYFLWKSLPDDELFRLAKSGKLTDSAVLERQVNRMLDDDKSDRFVNDFLDQWLDLDEIDATTPDEKLYPEYDDNLRQAMLKETRLFFRALIDENLSTTHLIDSDFTFLNRRLADHYGIAGREFQSRQDNASDRGPISVWPTPELPKTERLFFGEQMRQVELADDGVRGGLLTQASVLKVTANGTVTSPVTRGNFVLSKLLGTPPQPPPPDIGSIEPDTRGTITIRETLDAHRNTAACASCHQHIDPPGFALESFDPIGGFRNRYRSTEQGDRTNRLLYGRKIHEYKEGPVVDASGKTPDGQSFNGIREFKRLLMEHKSQVARNLVAQLVVYSTGGEIQFADRKEIDKVVDATKHENYQLRTLIHQVVQSRIFRNK